MQNKTTSRQVKTITFEGRPMLGSSSEEDERLRVLLGGNDTGHWGTSWWSYLETLSHSGCFRLQIAANNMQTRKSVLKTSSSMNLGHWRISLFIRLKEKERNVRGQCHSSVLKAALCAHTPFEITTGHGSWAHQLHSAEAEPNSLLEKASGWFSPGRQASPQVVVRICWQQLSTGPSIPTDSNKSLTFWDFCFGLVCFFAALNFWLLFRQRGIISEKEGIEVRDWRKRFPGP